MSLILAKGVFTMLHLIYQKTGELPDVFYGRRKRDEAIPPVMRDFAYASMLVQIKENSGEKIWEGTD